MRDVFLCHAGEDKETYVRPFADELCRHAVSYWLDEAEIRWGDSTARKINSGLSLSRYVVVFITESFFERNWPEAELGSAIDREIETGHTVVLPILVVSNARFKERYPLLSSKRYLRWNLGPSAIVGELLTLLDRPYKRKWSWIYPAGFKGPVWFRIAPNPNVVETIYTYQVAWGPWNHEARLDLSGGAVALQHSKSHDGEPVPITLEVNPPAYCDFGTDDPPVPRIIDINRGWKYAE